MLDDWLRDHPDLANEITTGGAQPLHMCGMGKDTGEVVPTLAKYGADLEAHDTYGMTPLIRMATNNCARAAELLLLVSCLVAYRGFSS